MRIALQSASAIAGAALVMLASPAMAQDSSGPAGASTNTGMSSGTASSDTSVTSSSSTSSSSAGYGSSMMSDNGTSFRGIRIEGDVGGDRFSSNGRRNTKLGYGATVGFDGQIGQRIVIGAEGSYWRANNFTENCAGVTGGSVCQKSFEEWGAAVRAGYLLSPQFLVFGKGGYVSNEQRKAVDVSSAVGSYYDHFHTDGYQYGGGVEYDVTNMRFPIYLNVQYVRSVYNDNTHRQRVMAGIGLHFK